MLNYGIIGFSCFKSNLAATVRTAELLKSKKPTIKIVLGGPEITRQSFRSEGKFSPKLLQIADHLIAGEGELSLYQYLICILRFPHKCRPEETGIIMRQHY